MSDMMKLFVQQELTEQIRANYQHMRYPPCIYAKVTRVKVSGVTYTATLKMLDKNKKPDNRFPEVPMVSTQIPIAKDDTVIVVLLYGECNPFIIGRCD